MRSKDALCSAKRSSFFKILSNKRFKLLGFEICNAWICLIFNMRKSTDACQVSAHSVSNNALFFFLLNNQVVRNHNCTLINADFLWLSRILHWICITWKTLVKLRVLIFWIKIVICAQKDFRIYFFFLFWIILTCCTIFTIFVRVFGVCFWLSFWNT